MLQCWSTVPEGRPKFSQLVTVLTEFLDSFAGYMEINMNLPCEDLAPDEGYEVMDPAPVSKNENIFMGDPPEAQQYEIPVQAKHICSERVGNTTPEEDVEPSE